VLLARFGEVPRMLFAADPKLALFLSKPLNRKLVASADLLHPVDHCRILHRCLHRV
jgi:hypothetical protein